MESYIWHILATLSVSEIFQYAGSDNLVGEFMQHRKTNIGGLCEVYFDDSARC